MFFQVRANISELSCHEPVSTPLHPPTPRSVCFHEVRPVCPEPLFGSILRLFWLRCGTSGAGRDPGGMPLEDLASTRDCREVPVAGGEDHESGEDAQL